MSQFTCALETRVFSPPTKFQITSCNWIHPASGKGNASYSGLHGIWCGASSVCLDTRTSCHMSYTRGAKPVGIIAFQLGRGDRRGRLWYYLLVRCHVTMQVVSLCERLSALIALVRVRRLFWMLNFDVLGNAVCGSEGCTALGTRKAHLAVNTVFVLF